MGVYYFKIYIYTWRGSYLLAHLLGQLHKALEVLDHHVEQPQLVREARDHDVQAAGLRNQKIWNYSIRALFRVILENLV